MKDAYYFPHDYNARNDEKILSLLQEKGAAGYGNYWMIIEMLYEAGGALRLNYERIAFALRSHCDEVKAVINDFDLFEISAAGTDFTSKRVLENIDIKNQKSKKASESAARRWDIMSEQYSNNANAMRTQCDGIDAGMRTQCDGIDAGMRTQCDGNAIKERKELKELKELKEMKETKKEKSQQNQALQLDDFSTQSHKCEPLGIPLTTQSGCVDDVDDKSNCTETVTEQYQSEINSKPVAGKYLNEFLEKGRALRNVKAQPESITNDERSAETKKRQKVMEWFLKYISIHPKKTKRFLVEQIWCDMFLNPTLSEEGAKELYGKIITALRTQKDKHPRDDADYAYFPAADAWLRDGRWMDEVEVRQPETLEEQAARLKKKFDVDEAARKAMYEREGIPYQ